MLAESQLHTYAKAIPTLLHLALHHTLFETLHKARAHQPAWPADLYLQWRCAEEVNENMS